MGIHVEMRLPAGNTSLWMTICHKQCAHTTVPLSRHVECGNALYHRFVPGSTFFKPFWHVTRQALEYGGFPGTWSKLEKLQMQRWQCAKPWKRRLEMSCSWLFWIVSTSIVGSSCLPYPFLLFVPVCLDFFQRAFKGESASWLRTRNVSYISARFHDFAQFIGDRSESLQKTMLVMCVQRRDARYLETPVVKWFPIY